MQSPWCDQVELLFNDKIWKRVSSITEKDRLKFYKIHGSLKVLKIYDQLIPVSNNTSLNSH